MCSSYNSVFFDYVTAGAVRSAEKLLPHLLAVIPVQSVLDVGCGRGAWLSVFAKLGVADLAGIDGDYVEREKLLIPGPRFFSANLADGFDLSDHYDLVMSLEVAEHLPTDRSAAFVASLVRHGDLILFSAAPKGQGGHDHVNEQDYAYWQELFASHGYWAVDYLRPLICEDKDIEPWYRYNPVIYVTPERFKSLPGVVRDRLIPAGSTVPDISPLSYRLRKQLLRRLPVKLMTILARVKESLAVAQPR